MARIRELKQAAQRLGVDVQTLREQGWNAAPEERIAQTLENPPEWLVEARERRQRKLARKRQYQDFSRACARLGISHRAAKEHGLRFASGPDALVEAILAEQPEWLAREQEQFQAHLARKERNRLRNALYEALEETIIDAAFQELKHAQTEEETSEIDDRLGVELARAKREAAQYAAAHTAEEVDRRIERERDSNYQAAHYRAARLARYAAEQLEEG
jgi:hypothetical protein